VQRQHHLRNTCKQITPVDAHELLHLKTMSQRGKLVRNVSCPHDVRPATAPLPPSLTIGTHVFASNDQCQSARSIPFSTE